MSIRIFAPLALALCLLGCSTPQPAGPAGANVSVQSIEPAPPWPARLAQVPQVQHYHGPLAPDAPPGAPELPDALKGRVCQLGTSCLSLDDRPFELCLLGTKKRCGDKIREPLLVENPVFVPDTRSR